LINLLDELGIQLRGHLDHLWRSVSFHDVPTYTRLAVACQAHFGTIWNFLSLEREAMAHVGSSTMAKKEKYIRIRADDTLKDALASAAERDVRTEADQARFLLMKSLGLIAEDVTHYRVTPKKGGGKSQAG
jgi:hypothetical protein